MVTVGSCRVFLLLLLLLIMLMMLLLEDVEDTKVELEFGARVVVGAGIVVVDGCIGKEVILEGCSPESNSYIF